MQRVIIDTDGGIDDALALLLAFAWPGTVVGAITTVHGNVPVEQATANVLEVLHIAGRECVVSQGCATPLTTEAVFAKHVHGADGLGGWMRVRPEKTDSVAGMPAPGLIASMARTNPGEITLVTIGPLTNAAVALREDPEGFRQLRRIVMMGGAIFEPGNVTATAEFNIYADPSAAREVVNSGVPVTLVGLDATHQVVFTREQLEEALAGNSGTRARFLRSICDQMFSFYQPLVGRDQFYLHDPLAVAVAFDPTLVNTRKMQIDIETAGELTRGMVVPERRPWAQTSMNVDVCVSVDTDGFLTRFVRLVCIGS